MADMQTIRERLAEAIAAARGNTNLSDDGRKRIIAAAYVKADNAAGTLRTQQAEQRASARRSVESRLFGMNMYDSRDPASVMLHRDARDRASRITSPEEAVRLLESSVVGGDKVMCRAILGQAMQNPALQGVVERYTEVMPDDTESVDELLGLNAADAQASTPAGRLMREMNDSLPRPEEIRRYPGSAIADLAAEAPDVQEIPPAPTFSGGGAIGAISNWRLIGGKDMVTGEANTE